MILLNQVNNYRSDLWSMLDVKWQEGASLVIKYISVLSENDQNDYDIYFDNLYTPHGIEHFNAVDRIVAKIINDLQDNNPKFELNDSEMLILFLSVWFHDIGMFKEVYQDYPDKSIADSISESRNNHELIAAWFLNNHHLKKYQLREIFHDKLPLHGEINNLLNTVAIIIKYHRRKYRMDTCPKYRYLLDHEIRVDLIASLLRIADTLHIDSSRFDNKKYKILRMIGGFDPESRLHWIKSFVISKIFLDMKRKTIRIVLDLPEKNKNDDSVTKLKSQISDEIYEDLCVVDQVFFKHGIEFYRLLEIECNYIAEMDRSIKNDISAVLNNLDIMGSPNDSKIISTILYGLTILYGDSNKEDEVLWKEKFEPDFDTLDFGIDEKIIHFIKSKLEEEVTVKSPPDVSQEISLKNELSSFVSYLNSIYDKRPCHLGVLSIITVLKELLNGKQLEGKLRTTLYILIKYIEIKRLKNIRNINAKAHQHLKDINHIFLFGYSQMVVEFLSNYYFEQCMAGQVNKEKVDHLSFYIFECAGKNSYSSGSHVTYNDGVRYALTLAQAGFKNIEILPDISIATLLYNLSIRNDQLKLTPNNGIMLFGANGVDENDHVLAHSSGHRAMAIIAQFANVPIKVIADDIKYGRLLDRNEPVLREEKEKEWMLLDADVRLELKEYKIELKNYREDRIPFIDISKEGTDISKDDTDQAVNEGPNKTIKIELINGNIESGRS